VFENRALRRIFGPKRDEVTGEQRKLHNEELCDLFSLPIVIRMIKSRMRLARHVAQLWDMRIVYMLLVGKPEGKRPLASPVCRWVYNIKMDDGDIGWGGGGSKWIVLAQDRDKWRALVNAVMNLRVP
jgi:hypothetical protein